jgi:hypothetical protein
VLGETGDKPSGHVLEPMPRMSDSLGLPGCMGREMRAVCEAGGGWASGKGTGSGGEGAIVSKTISSWAVSVTRAGVAAGAGLRVRRRAAQLLMRRTPGLMDSAVVGTGAAKAGLSDQRQLSMMLDWVPQGNVVCDSGRQLLVQPRLR